MSKTKASLRPLSDHSLLMSQSCDDDEEGERQGREITNLTEMCAGLKATLDSAITRISSLEATVNRMG